MRKRALAAAVLAGMATQASAFQIDTSEDWEVRWDNTFKYNLQRRVQSQASDVEEVGLGIDGTYAFDKGDITSNRLDLLSELDVIWKDTIGFRISGAAWYDHAYSNDMNHSGDVGISSGWSTSLTTDVGELNDQVEKRHYKGGELLDAFVFWNWEAGDIVGNVRAGRHVIYWGQSLLANAAVNTAGNAMNPMDFAKGLSVPGSEAKELFRPTNKLSTMVQLTDNLTFSAFYNFETDANLYPQAGSYWSPSSVINDGGETAWLAPGLGLTIQNDVIDTDYNDWGVNFAYYFEDLGLEASLYYINYTDKTPNGLIGYLSPTNILAQGLGGITNPAQIPAVLAQVGGYATAQGIDDTAGQAAFNATLGGTGDPTAALQAYAFTQGELLALADGSAALNGGALKWIYKNDIDLFGLSFSKQVGDVSVGVDIVRHENRPLRPESGEALTRTTWDPTWNLAAYNAADEDSNYPHITGDTWTVVINGLGLLSDNGIWEGGSYIVEATFTMIDDVHDNAPERLLVYDNDQSGLQSLNEGRVSSHLAFVFRPTWYQVMPGVDLTVPFSVGYQIDGDGPISSSGDNEWGSGSLGLSFSVNQEWTADLKYNFYGGPVNNTSSQLKDRDNVSLTVKRTF